MANPQVLYTPQQQMGYGGYSVPCRVGNWAEDEYLNVILTATHQAKQEQGMLTSQQLGGTLGSALAPATLAPAPSDGALKYGDVVMLSAAMGGVLAVDTISRMDLPQEAYSVTRTKEAGAVACTRTAWTGRSGSWCTRAYLGQWLRSTWTRVGVRCLLVRARGPP